MKTSPLFNRFAASLVVLCAAATMTPALATTKSKTVPTESVAPKATKAKVGRSIRTQRTKLPREWVWQKKVVKFDGMFVKR